MLQFSPDLGTKLSILIFLGGMGALAIVVVAFVVWRALNDQAWFKPIVRVGDAALWPVRALFRPLPPLTPEQERPFREQWASWDIKTRIRFCLFPGALVLAWLVAVVGMFFPLDR